MRLNLKFRERMTQVGAWLTTEFDQVLAAIRGSWLTEHTEDDSHSDIHGYSLTLTKDTTTGKTGDVIAGGEGTFGEDVTAMKNDPSESALGFLDGLTGTIGPHTSALKLGRDTPWIITQRTGRNAAFTGGGSNKQLSIWNVDESSTVPVIQIAANSGVESIIDGAAGSPGLQLGLAARPLKSVTADIIKYYEGTRAQAMGEWTTYTPTIFITGGGFALGNGTQAGRYMLVGKTCTFQVSFTVGGTTNFGAGGILGFPLPFTAAANFFRIGIGTAYMNIAANEYGGIVFSNLGGAQADCYIIVSGTANGWYTNLFPAAAAAGDYFVLSGTYEIP